MEPAHSSLNRRVYEMNLHKKIIIIGGGGHARVLEEILRIVNDFVIMGFLDGRPNSFMEAKYLGGDAVLEQYSPREFLLINGIGSVTLPVERRRIFEQFKARSYCFGSVIHPQAVISSQAEMSEGVQVMAGAVINPGAKIAENVIVNTGTIVDHDCRIGAHSHLSPGVTLSGSVVIGRGCHIGAGTTVIQGVTIGDGVLLGAGSVVLKDIPPGVKAFGVPAKVRA